MLALAVCHSESNCPADKPIKSCNPPAHMPRVNNSSLLDGSLTWKVLHSTTQVYSRLSSSTDASFFPLYYILLGFFTLQEYPYLYVGQFISLPIMYGGPGTVFFSSAIIDYVGTSCIDGICDTLVQPKIRRAIKYKDGTKID